MIDVHCHCLPGLDDGPALIDQAEALCRAAAADGCEHIIATPHQRLGRWWNCDPEKLDDLRRELADRLGSTIGLHLGAEIRVDHGLLDDLESSDRAGILTLAGTDYLLLEFPRTGPSPDPEEIVHEVCLLGLRPILAHPELIDDLGQNPALIGRLVELGAYVQVTAMSLLGRFGRRPKARAETMLDKDLVHFIASDAHDMERRPPGLDAARELVSVRWGKDRAHRLTNTNGLRVLRNEPIAHAAEHHYLQSARS